MNQLENEWFYLDGNTRKGPLTADKMRSMLAEGAIPKNCDVWRSGMADWHRPTRSPS